MFIRVVVLKSTVVVVVVVLIRNEEERSEIIKREKERDYKAKEFVKDVNTINSK